MQDWKEIFFKLLKNLALNFSPVTTECTLAFHVLKCLTLSFTKHTNRQSTISSQPSLSVTSQVILSNQ